MKLDPGSRRGMGSRHLSNEDTEKYLFHFPDEGATIARLLVRKLIPATIPGDTDLDILTSRANYFPSR
jgi:spermidine dehydrogenase